ncbi:MAG: choice-of-anchor tandem repeat GloVer-containing protein [Candidatus Korobacteraceae bacterium]
MQRPAQTGHRNCLTYLWMTIAATVIATLLVLAATSVHAQTFTVLHSFSRTDGWFPDAGLTIDRAGNLYGTTADGGTLGGSCCGTVFKMSQRGSGWVLSELHLFSGGSDGTTPLARVVFGPDGTLYGTASGGGLNGDGVVFNLQPPATACKSVSCPWIETILFPFQGYSNPSGDLVFDATGNIYGTTFNGGNYSDCAPLGCGTLYQLAKSGGVWTEDIIHIFTGGTDGQHPDSGVIFDPAGNLYGTAVGNPNQNGNNAGLVFQFVPSGGGWTENVLYQFQPGGQDGEYPYAGLVFDPAGNLYGTTTVGGSNGGGIFYELSPSGSDWNFTSQYSFPRPGFATAGGPYEALIRDGAGNLYGTTATDGANGFGAVFKLTPSNGGWIYTSLHDFNFNDGYYPLNVVMDARGNLYGITSYGGNTSDCQYGCGVIFEITP